MKERREKKEEKMDRQFLKTFRRILCETKK